MINVEDLNKNIDQVDLLNVSVRVLVAQMNGWDQNPQDMKDLSGNHLVGCDCSLCSWVDLYQYEDAIINPSSEPEYVY